MPGGLTQCQTLTEVLVGDESLRWGYIARDTRYTLGETGAVTTPEDSHWVLPIDTPGLRRSAYWVSL